MPLDPQAKFVLDQLTAQGGLAVEDSTPAEARKAFDSMRMPLPGEPVARIENRTIPGPGGALPVRVYTPEAARPPAPAVVYFHGGGWVIGSPDTHDNLCRALANRARAVVVSVDYRLAPEHHFPAAAEDCYAAAGWVADHAAEIGADGARLAVAGDSAGGNLAAVVALMARNLGGPALRQQTLIYPVTNADFETPSYRDNAEGYMLTRDAMRWFWDHYVPDRARRSDPYASPLCAEKFGELPPALVVTAEYDPLRDEGEAYAARLAEAGVPSQLSRYDGQIHGFVSMFELLDAGQRAVEQIGSALRTALA
ncbi:MAG TPA: alpha/beta hydrolase [Myxococcota bacterium]|nr:alpha/beta hydrolase [Myxococcota bacterium]